MKKWFKLIEGESRELSDYFGTALNYREIEFYDLPLEVLSQNEKRFGKDVLKYLETISIPIHLFSSNSSSATMVFHKATGEIFVHDFFFQTLIGRTLIDFKCCVFCFHLLSRHLFPDLQIDVSMAAKELLRFRQNRLSSQQKEVLLYGREGSFHFPSFGLAYSALVQKKPLSEISAMEKRIIHDALDLPMAKKMLGLDESAYRYIEKPANPKDEDYLQQMETCLHFSREIEKSKISLEQYSQRRLVDKNMLVWCWWTISPFVAADLSSLLPLLAQTKNIRRVYVDLCPSSQPLFEAYIDEQDISEEALENEIKKIYPPVFEDYEKETLLYLVLLEKLKLLSLPIQCFGFEGEKMLAMEPLLENEKLLYPVDERWRLCLEEEYRKLDSREEDDLVIFFQSLKPMHAIPDKIHHSKIEKIIHTDPFTGYGPYKPENSLSAFSRHTSTSHSFVLPKVNRSSIKDEIVVFFPDQDNAIFPKLNDIHFNRFQNYDTLIYSAYRNEGGGENKALGPVDPAIYQPTF